MSAPRDTLTPARAASERWDVVVVGAGPAGALAARRLALQGARVLLLDRARFPRPKVCGGCLGPRGLSVLAAEGLPAPPARAAPVEQLRLRCGRRELVLPLPPMVAVAREDLDAALVVAAVQAGAQLLQGVRAEAPAEPNGAWRTLRLQHGGGDPTRVEARLVIAADGLAGRLLQDAAPAAGRGSRVGAGVLLPATPEAPAAGELVLAIGTAGYVGLVRLPDGRLDVAAALDPQAIARAGGAAALMIQLLGESGAPPPAGLDGAEVRVTPPLTRRTARPAGHRLLAIGDAAGFVEPFTGEGLSWALLSARAVAPLALLGARGWEPGIASAWARAHGEQVRRRQRLCAVLAAWLRHPALVRGTLALAARRPSLAHGVLARLGAPPAGAKA